MNINKSLEMVQIIAKGLGDLKDEVVFVGGAIVALYIDDEAAPEIRPTDDVDCVIEIINRASFYKLEKNLRKKGFKNDIEENSPICRFIYCGIKVDIMPIDKNILGFNKDLFCVFITDNGKLYIDHIINDFPIIATAHNLSRVISYFFIQNITTLFNSLRIDAEFSQVAKIPLNKYIMFWENYYVDYREYLNKGDSKIKLYTMKTVNKEHIDVCEECDEKILENCIK